MLPPVQGRPEFPEADGPSKDALRVANIHRVVDRPTLQCVSTRNDNICSLEDLCESFPVKQEPQMSTDKKGTSK